ncbi:Os03g0294032 [Oryza sativa Japonica Group]|uniref:Os03g0294032 protein n=1 Tax=Oryza sativa subsp. japonica TaxID=39947 RepID=C7J0I6_ORYSJ|nr:Os03g0294032 [Oryza sativa Japonica Group]|eukprot:NP_001173379.1 Os03g0294032 [Oryza sativa Japonica Group]
MQCCLLTVKCILHSVGPHYLKKEKKIVGPGEDSLRASYLLFFDSQLLFYHVLLYQFYIVLKYKYFYDSKFISQCKYFWGIDSDAQKSKHFQPKA